MFFRKNPRPSAFTCVGAGKTAKERRRREQQADHRDVGVHLCASLCVILKQLNRLKSLTKKFGIINYFGKHEYLQTDRLFWCNGASSFLSHIINKSSYLQAVNTRRHNFFLLYLRQ